MSASDGVVLDATAEVLLKARSVIAVCGVAAGAAVAARARLRENIVYGACVMWEKELDENAKLQ